MDKEIIKSIFLTDKEEGETYELNFSRDSVRFAEQRGFVLEDVLKFKATLVPELWFYAFRMHHKNKARSQTDALLDKIGGITPQMLERLMMLYQQAQLSNAVQTDEELAKNETVTVEM